MVIPTDRIEKIDFETDEDTLKITAVVTVNTSLEDKIDEFSGKPMTLHADGWKMEQ